MNAKSLAFLTLIICSSVLADPYDDCVLNGMRGVSSDAAARLVAQSCRNKIDEAQKTKMSSFGSSFSEDEYIYINGKGSVATYDDGYYSQTLKNKSTYKTITYLALIIKDGDFYDYKTRNDFLGMLADINNKFKWESERSRTYYYKLSLQPNSEIQVKFRKPKTDSFYAEVQAVLGRESKWSDKVSTSSFLGSVKPEPKDPLE